MIAGSAIRTQVLIRGVAPLLARVFGESDALSALHCEHFVDHLNDNIFARAPELCAAVAKRSLI